MPSLRPSVVCLDRPAVKLKKPAVLRLASSLEPFPFRFNRNGALIICSAAFSDGKPVPTFPENALSESGRNTPDFAPERLLASGFHELMAGAPGDESATLALVFSMASRAAGETGKNLCFCTLASEAQERGELYGYGFGALGLKPGQLVMVTASKEKGLLWTLEEAIASGAFGTVIGALGVKERLYAFAASRRLKLRASANETPLFLLRHRSNGGATAAQGRWRVSSTPSRPEGEHAGHRFLGPPRLQLRLERMAGFRPRKWEMEFDAARGFHMAFLLEDGSAGGAGKRRRQTA